MRDVGFDKYEGLGNDFVVIDAADESAVPASRVPAICDRRFGVGGDGVLLVLPPRDPANAARMRVMNADGSIPEMCGNGLRCVAVHVARARGAERAELVIETDAGPRACVVEGEIVSVDMGPVRVTGERTIEAAGRALSFVLADAGNPHAVTFDDVRREMVARVGPAVATHAMFPRGTNVEMARMRDDGGIDLVVWERGVGLTLACGTGACATVAAACSRGLAPWDTDIEVHLPGGPLIVRVARADSAARMRGPAHRVFRGTLA